MDQKTFNLVPGSGRATQMSLCEQESTNIQCRRQDMHLSTSILIP